MNQITCDRFSSFQLKNIDVVVISNLHELTHDQLFALKTYLQNGGGMLFFPGSQTTINTFNTDFAAPLGISTVTASENDFKSPSSDSFVEFDKVDLRHPLFSGMFEETKTKQSVGTAQQRVLESPRVNKSLHFVPSVKSHSIITLTNGYPFLIDEKIGSGQILLFSVAANTEWSDLPLKGLFVPLVHRSIIYLAQKSEIEHSLLAGEETTIPLHTPVQLRLKIIRPGNLETFINPRQLTAKSVVLFSDDDLLGIYTVASGNLILDKFAVNIDPDESNTTPSDKKHIENTLKRIGIMDNSTHIVNQIQEVQHIITESRLGTKLWKQFLIAAIGMAVIEMFVARDNKRHNSSAALQLK